MNMDILNEQKNLIPVRVGTWKSFLNYFSLKKDINYNKILNELTLPQNLKILEKNSKMISIDIARTNFSFTDEKDKEKNRDSLKNILNAFYFINRKISYCQGMNYLVLFLYEITQKKEEETFYIMEGLLKYTEFIQIFEGNFEKLQIFFYIMDRLIFLLLPKIFSHFKDNQIKMSFFMSPFFITLFTNVYAFKNKKNENNFFILNLWDEFILYGWKAVFGYLITVIKYYEKKILGISGEELINFLVNEMNKEDLFNDKNYESFMEIRKNFSIGKEILTNLENEAKLEMEIKNINKSYIENLIWE